MFRDKRWGERGSCWEAWPNGETVVVCCGLVCKSSSFGHLRARQAPSSSTSASRDTAFSPRAKASNFRLETRHCLRVWGEEGSVMPYARLRGMQWRT